MVKIKDIKELQQMTKKELLEYNKKLRTEVNRRQKRFEEDDFYFVKQKKNYNMYVGKNKSKKFMTGNISKMKKSDVIMANVKLEKIIKDKQSTKKGRQEQEEQKYKSFVSSHPGIDKRTYRKFIKLISKKEFQRGLKGSINSYMLSEQIVESYSEGFNDSNIIDTIIKIGEENLQGLSKGVTGEMILDVLKGENINEVLEMSRNNYTESNL